MRPTAINSIQHLKVYQEALSYRLSFLSGGDKWRIKTGSNPVIVNFSKRQTKVLKSGAISHLPLCDILLFSETKM